jgi:polysaccharide export outer membrane protein
MSRHYFCRSAFTALALIAAFTTGAVASEPTAANPPGATATYLLQAGDVISISVWKEPELQAEVLVRPDGGLSFPLAGDMMAAGLTVQQLTAQLDERLRIYIPKPVVTVALKLNGGNRLYVLGKVNRPGEFPFAKPIDVMQALALAGGTTPFAELNDIQVLRRTGEKQVSIRFRYAEVSKGHDLEQNVLLHSGDTVVVP